MLFSPPSPPSAKMSTLAQLPLVDLLRALSGSAWWPLRGQFLVEVLTYQLALFDWAPHQWCSGPHLEVLRTHTQRCSDHTHRCSDHTQRCSGPLRGAQAHTQRCLATKRCSGPHRGAQGHTWQCWVQTSVASDTSKASAFVLQCLCSVQCSSGAAHTPECSSARSPQGEMPARGTPGIHTHNHRLMSEPLHCPPSSKV